MARAKVKKDQMVITGQTGVSVEELPLELRFPLVQPKPLNDDLPQPWASVPGEVAVEQPKLSKPICKVCSRALSDDDAYPQDGDIYCWDHYPSSEVQKAEEQPAEAAQAEAQEEPVPEPVVSATPEKRKLDLSVILENSAEALGYSEEYIQRAYDTGVSEVSKLEDKINKLRERLIDRRDFVEELGRKFSFVKQAKEDLGGYVQGSLPLKFDDTPSGEPENGAQACVEISEPAQAEESEVREEVSYADSVEFYSSKEAAQAEELSDSEKALGEVINALGEAA